MYIYINVREQSELEQKCLLNVFCKKKKKVFYRNENLILFCFCYDVPVQPVVCYKKKKKKNLVT